MFTVIKVKVTVYNVWLFSKTLELPWVRRKMIVLVLAGELPPLPVMARGEVLDGPLGRQARRRWGPQVPPATWQCGHFAQHTSTKWWWWCPGSAEWSALPQVVVVVGGTPEYWHCEYLNLCKQDQPSMSYSTRERERERERDMRWKITILKLRFRGSYFEIICRNAIRVV